MFSRLGIRGRILAVVALPIVFLIAANTVLTFRSVNEYQDASTSEQIIEIGDIGQDLAVAVAQERYIASMVSTTYNANRDRMAVSQGEIDDYLAQLRDAGAEDVADSVEEQLATLSDARSLDIVRSDEAGQLPAYPSEQEIGTAGAAYTAAAEAIAGIAGSAPAAVQPLVLGIAQSVGAEAEAMVRSLGVSGAYAAAFPEAIVETDTQRTAVLEAVAGLPDNETTARAQSAVETVSSEIANIEIARTQSAALFPDTFNIAEYYDSALTAMASTQEDLALVLTDPDVAQYERANSLARETISAMSREQLYIDMVLERGYFNGVPDNDAEFIRQLIAATDAVHVEAERAVEGLPGISAIPELGEAAEGDVFLLSRQIVSAGEDFALETVDNEAWDAASQAEIDAVAVPQAELADRVSADATAATQDALTRAIITAILALAFAIVSAAIALSMARAVARPLLRLTTTAAALREDLPSIVDRVATPGEEVDASEIEIPIESTDEVGRLAEAFNGVNATTIEIAREQAALRASISEMFVNVARRDQVLLNRQLSSIDEMERSEDNPETLTRLFGLDHLATRMRRNSESLLVLAGIDSGRRIRTPMPLSDVVRTATSEIELYERITLELGADPTMLGHSALTAAHLFAELLENATVFSDPGSPVVVRTSIDGDNVVVTVEDNGIGMGATDLEAARGRVESHSASELLGEQRLGLFVVGRLAERLGARVSIDSTESEGTTVTVALPSSLFTGMEQAAPIAAPAPAPAALPVAEPTPEVTPAPHAEEYTPEATPATAAGLTRRERRRQESPEPSVPSAPIQPAPSQTASGLPSRAGAAAAGAAGLAAGAAVAASRSNDALDVHEVMPQTAEQRAAVFRGFRARREVEALQAAQQPYSPPITPREAEQTPEAAAPAPAMTPEELAAESVPFMPRQDDGQGEAVSDESAAPARESQFDEPEPELAWGRPQPEPAISAPVVEPEPMVEPEPEPAAEAPAPSVEPEPQTSAAGLPTRRWRPPASKSLETPAGMVVPMVAPSDDDPAAAAVAVPSVASPEDEPAAQAAPAEEETVAEQPARQSLFGTPVAHPDAPVEPEPAPVAEESPFPAFAPVSEPAAPAVEEPSAAQDEPADAPAESEPEFPWASQTSGAAAGAAAAAALPWAAQNPPGAQQSPSMDDLLAPPQEEAGFFGRIFGRKAKGAPESAPAAPAAPSSQDSFAPAEPAQDTPQFSPAHESPQFSPAQDFEPEPQSWQPAAPERASEPEPQPMEEFASWQPPAPAESWMPEAGSTPYGDSAGVSPDQLAKPLGWESAGASAVEGSALPSYQPVIDPEPVSPEPQEDDYASEVYSEFNSLSSERPTVDRTRAGLQRRQPAAPAPAARPAPEPEPVAAQAQRDPDAIRAQFSQFYAATQRARTDAQALHENDTSEWQNPATSGAPRDGNA